MPEIKINVNNRIAKAEKDAVMVCRNSDYAVVFNFDEEWSGFGAKTALFTYNGRTIPVPFSGSVCQAPELIKTVEVLIGVTTGDLTNGDTPEIQTTTSAYVPCFLSAKDETDEYVEPPKPEVYDELIALINSGMMKGETGDSAYEEWLKLGNEGSVEDFLLSLKGEQGEQGEQGIQGEKGDRFKYEDFTPEQLEGLKPDMTDYALEEDLTAVENALLQSGMTEKITTESAYASRVTAYGARVVDGSKSKLHRIVGKTAERKQYLDISKAILTTGYQITSSIDESKRVITLVSTAENTGNGNVLLGNKLRDVCPDLEVGKTYYLNADVQDDVTVSNKKADKTIILDTGGSWNYGTGKEITEQILNARAYIRGTKTYGTATITDLRITKESDTPWSPYIEGSMNATFAGIKSVSVSGEESIFNFPKTALPSGAEIDFDRQVIVNADGTETPFTEEMEFAGKEYQVWAGGTETVLGNDGAEYGATPTLLQSYTIVNEMGQGSGSGEGGNVDLSDYQKKVDSGLQTTAKTIVGAINEVNSKGNQNASDIATLKTNVSNLQTSVNGKQDKLTFDGTYNASSNKVATVSTVTDKIAEVVADAPEAFNTLAEIAAWIAKHPENVAAINAAIQANVAAIEQNAQGITEALTQAKAYTDEQITIALESDY